MKLFGSICISDIPQELIRTNEKNGKQYLTVVVAERRSPSQYGYTHHIKAYAKKGEVAEGVNLYIGELKPSTYQDVPQGDQPKVEAQPKPQPENPNVPFFNQQRSQAQPELNWNVDDLPF